MCAILDFLFRSMIQSCIMTKDRGGANSYWNLLLYLVEKYTDRDTAILASKYFAIDVENTPLN